VFFGGDGRQPEVGLRSQANGGVSRVQKFGIVRTLQLKMQENVLKPKETATVHARKHFSRGLGRNWDENGQKRPFAA